LTTNLTGAINGTGTGYTVKAPEFTLCSCGVPVAQLVSFKCRVDHCLSFVLFYCLSFFTAFPFSIYCFCLVSFSFSWY